MNKDWKPFFGALGLVVGVFAYILIVAIIADTTENATNNTGWGLAAMFGCFGITAIAAYAIWGPEK